MVIHNLQVEVINSDNEEAKVDLEGELVSALEEIERPIKKNKSQKESLIKEKVKNFEPLLLQIDESKKIQESLNQQLHEKVQACKRTKGEIVLLKKELEKTKTQLSFSKTF